MKIILTHEVPNLGAPGDIVEVRDGYGRNFLLPQGMAMRATRGAEKQVATIKRARQVREVRDLGHAQEIRSQLLSLDVTLHTRAGDGGRLFGSVTPADVVGAVCSAGGPELDRRRIDLPGHIKSLGKHEVTVRLHPEVAVTFPITVAAEA